ncbi:potassium channel family protein [Marinobacter sp. BW6]|uniref:potassium channel family protein n=1 Tax=Marinobacter sp. BW6 TaxID=2592624 RepID=UPI0013968163|nr:potassium channel family protein [Marinobacter sp. BW6]
MNKLLEFVVSPTYFYADYRKSKVSKEERTELIKKYNRRYLVASWFLAAMLGLTWQWNEYPSDGWLIPYGVMVAVLVWLFPFSRSNEIFLAFLEDAYDKVSHKDPSSNLLFSERIRLALHSYIELLANFAIIYYLIPKEWFSEPLEGIWDALYYSGVTITTLGYGDIHPAHWIPKGLVVYEVFCGFILLIVSFAIYAGRGMERDA